MAVRSADCVWYGFSGITLYPDLIKKIRVLIYNGDADSCVPYVGNEEWVSGLAKLGYASEAKAWHPCMPRARGGQEHRLALDVSRATPRATMSQTPT